MFANDQVEVVAMAVKSLIQRLEFPPTIADVKKEITSLVEIATDKPTAIDEWNAIRAAIGNAIYNAGAMFEGLPPIAKQFVGTPNQLRQWAVAEDFNAEVLRGQFLKQYDVLYQREQRKTMLQDSTIVQRLTDQYGTKLIGDANG